MWNNKTKSILIAVVATPVMVCAFCCCHSGVQKNIHDAGLKEILIDPGKVDTFLDLSDILNDSVEIIPLETKDECLISEIDRLEFYKDRIFVADRKSAKILIFTSAGKYLKSVGKQGVGPGEYSFMGGFTFKGDSIVVQDRFRGKYIVYDLYSNSYREISYNAFHLEVVSFDEIAYLISNYYPSTSGNYNLFKFNFNTSEQVSAELSFEKGGIDKSVYGLRRYSSRCGDNATLIYPLNDTVYTLNKEGIYPSYVIRFTERNLPDELSVDKDMLYRYVHLNRYLKGWEYLQSSRDYLLGYYIDDGFKFFVYDKRKSDIRIGGMIKISSLSDLAFYDFTTTIDNEFCFIQSASMLSCNWNTMRDKCTNSSFKDKMDAALETLSDDSNPVLFKYHFKKK